MKKVSRMMDVRPEKKILHVFNNKQKAISRSNTLYKQMHREREFLQV